MQQKIKNQLQIQKLNIKLNIINFQKIQKSTKKVEFAALLKQKKYFVPRGTNVENFLRGKF